jgi:hypothetical protein
MKKIKHNGYELKAVFGTYKNKATAILLTDAETGDPYMTATVCLPDFPLFHPDHTLIKDWSENAGILDALTEAGIVRPLGIQIPTGFVSADLVQIVKE